jgi:hypothetical protein
LVPDDATVVVIARPTQEFQPAEVKVLQDYLARREEKDKDGKVKVTAGKLFILLDPIIERQGGKATMARTGLDGLFAAYSVKVGNDRILNLRLRNPVDVLAVTNPNSANPVAKAFFPNQMDKQIFSFQSVRTVDVAQEKGGAKAADRLMLVPPDLLVWAESDLSRDPVALRDSLREDEDRIDKIISRKPLSMAVTASDSSGGDIPRDAAHAPVLKDTPRLVVFGSANWLTDTQLDGALGTLRMDLFSSCVSWLREKSSIGVDAAGGIGPSRRSDYRLNIPPTEANRLRFLPLGLLLLLVVGLGTGVWVVRRR